MHGKDNNTVVQCIRNNISGKIEGKRNNHLHFLLQYSTVLRLAQVLAQTSKNSLLKAHHFIGQELLKACWHDIY